MNNDFKSNMEEKKGKKNKYGFIVFIIALLSAVLLWFYVLGYDSPHYEKEFTVPLEVEGEAILREKSGFTLLSDIDFSIKVTISGPQTEVNKVRTDDIKAYIDISEATEPGKNSLPVNVVIPNENNIKLEKKSLESAIVYIDKCIAAEIPVSIEVSNYIIESGYSLGDYTTSPVTVTVEGPEKELERIAIAKGTIHPGTVTESRTFNTKVTLLDSHGSEIENSFIRLIDTSVNVELPVYKEANIPVKVYFVGGYFGTDSAVIKLSKDFIRVRGEAGAIDELKEIRMNIAENTLTSGTIVKKISLPDGVINVDNTEYVTAEIEFNDIVTRIVAMACSPICRFVNAPDDLEIKVTTVNLNVTVKGPKDELVGLSQQSFEGIIDFENISLKSGESYLLPIQPKIKDELSSETNGVFVSGEYVVEVTVE